MSTTNLDIEEIFPNYELVDTAATKAELADVIDVSSVADGDAFTVNGTTINIVAAITTPAAGEIQVKNATSATLRNRVKQAINGTEITEVSYGSGLSNDGISGVSASDGTSADEVTLQAAQVGANTISAANVTGGAVQNSPASSTGTAATGAVKIPLSDLSVSGNPLTVDESQDDTGDFRKLCYHFIRKYEEYLTSLESVTSINITGAGSGYTTSDAVTLSGGSPTTTATAQISSVDGSGAITGISITNAGSGYSSAPTVSVTSSTGSAATLAAVLTADSPARLSVSKGSLVENTAAGTISRTYTVTFGFSEGGLEIAGE